MALSKVKIHAAPGEAYVELDGQDISEQLTAARIDLEGRGIPKVWLQTQAGSLDFDGEAEVAVVSEGGAAEFLRAIDPGLLDQAVNTLLQTEAGTYAELTLAVLRGWAEGK